MRTRLKTAASAVAISTSLAVQTAAGQSGAITFDIEAKAVAQALQDFAEQSGYQMAFLAEALSLYLRAHEIWGDRRRWMV